jgi:hypothetical protein
MKILDTQCNNMTIDQSWSYRDRQNPEKARSRTEQDTTGKCRTGNRIDNKGDDRSG